MTSLESTPFPMPPTLLKDLKRKSTFISVMMPSLPLPGMERILWILGFHVLMRIITPILMVSLSRMRTIPLSWCRMIMVMASSRPMKARCLPTFQKWRVRFGCKAITIFIVARRAIRIGIILTWSKSEWGNSITIPRQFTHVGGLFCHFFKVILNVVPSPITEDLTKIFPLW